MVFGPDKRVLDVCATNPGSNHDSHVFDTCFLKDRLEQKAATGNFRHWLGGTIIQEFYFCVQ